jgi:hypothetical protein
MPAGSTSCRAQRVTGHYHPNQRSSTGTPRGGGRCVERIAIADHCGSNEDTEVCRRSMATSTRGRVKLPVKQLSRHGGENNKTGARMRPTLVVVSTKGERCVFFFLGFGRRFSFVCCCCWVSNS